MFMRGAVSGVDVVARVSPVKERAGVRAGWRCGERELPPLLPAVMGRWLQVDECHHGICGVYRRGVFVKPCV